MKKIYFAGSIRGGRNDNELYAQIIVELRSFGEVLTEHVGYNSLSPSGEVDMSDQEIYNRDMKWLTSSDIVVAEVSMPSLGVGFEIASAIGLKKDVLCLHRSQSGKKLSAMISGCPDVRVMEYQTLDDAKQILDEFLSNEISG
jgi:2'-deoxynucleoside 5'-phosphate N-hydrolase